MDMTSDPSLQESCMAALRHTGVEVMALIGKTNELESENAKLREELEQWHRLTAGIKLPEYPITEFKPKDIERENASLRELVRMYGEYVSQDRCEGCACKSRCNDGDVDECWQLTEIRGLERELGAGADE